MPRRFKPALINALDEIKHLRIRSGDHRFIAVWVVVVDGRVLIRSWNDKPTGWFRAFRKEPSGAIMVGDREIPAHGVPVRSAKLADAADEAYAAKYTTNANRKYVRGFKTAKRKAATLELVPA